MHRLEEGGCKEGRAAPGQENDHPGWSAQVSLAPTLFLRVQVHNMVALTNFSKRNQFFECQKSLTDRWSGGGKSLHLITQKLDKVQV